MKLLIIRHGEPDYTADSLTEKGWREAELLAEPALLFSVAFQKELQVLVLLQHLL